MRLRTSLALGFAGVAAAVALVVGVATWTATAQRLDASTDQSLREGAFELHGRLEGRGIAGAAAGTRFERGGGRPAGIPSGTADDDGAGPGGGPDDDGDLASRTVLPAQLLAADGTVTTLQLTTTTLPVRPADVAVAADDEARLLYSDVVVGGEHYRMLTWGAGNGRGAVQIARDARDNDRVLGGLAIAVTLIGLVTALLAAGAGVLLARRLTRRLERLGDATREVARTGSFDVSVPEGGSDEVADLGHTFNDMLRRLSLLRERQERLLADAGHELRTPLTSLRTNISLLERFGELPPAARTRVVDDLRGESRELSTLVEEVLSLARGTTDAQPPEPLLLNDVARSVVERARRRTGRTISLTGPDDPADAVVLGDRAALQRAVWNLLDNAQKFDPTGSPVDVAVTADGLGVTVTVADRGPGVPDDERDAVFERFHRGAAARAVAGSGLGLSIVADVVAQHGGAVRLEPREGGGTVAVLTLPLAPPDATD